MREWLDIEDVIAEYEKDPAMAEHLRKARIKLAPTLHAMSPNQERYDRMMRGEGPPKHQPQSAVNPSGPKSE